MYQIPLISVEDAKLQFNWMYVIDQKSEQQKSM